jgi:ribosomal protein S18 acetylase RimI-like enzyme
MVAIEPITWLNVLLFKEVRLRALEDSPGAFDSTYGKESQFADSEWMQRVEQWNGMSGAGFLAMDAGTACGIAGSFLDQNDPTRAHLISMWTAPTHRNRGIGRLLVNEVLNWARGRNARALQLMVTSNNEQAIRFYHRLGFTQTGRTEPYPNDPAVVEYEMSRPIP